MSHNQHFHRGVGQVSAGDIHNHGPVVHEQGYMPPSDPAQARICPQCGHATWRLTRYCIHCGLDLPAHDAAQWQIARNRRVLWLLCGLAVVGFGGLLLGKVLPGSAAGWSTGIGVAALFLGINVMRD